MKTPKRARGDEQKAKRRASIIDAAERVIARVGLKNAHFGEVAKASRLSRPLIYVYFPKQEDLFHAVCERALQALAVKFDQVATRPGNGLAQVVALARAYHDFALAQPLYFSVISELQAYGIDPAHANEIELSVFHLSKRLLGQVGEAVEAGKRDGSIRTDCGDSLVAGMSVWAIAHGLIQISLTKEKMLAAEFALTSKVVADQGFELLRHSLAARG